MKLVRPATTLFAAALVAPTLVVALAAPATSVPVDRADVTVMPRLASTDRFDTVLRTVSAKYVMHDVADRSEARPTPSTIVRNDDGSVVTHSYLTPSDVSRVELAGDRLLEYAGDTIRVRDVETQTSLGTLQLHGSPLSFDGVTAVIEKFPEPSPRVQVWLQRLDGTEAPVEGVWDYGYLRYAGRDGTHVFITDQPGQRLWDVDTVTGTAQIVPAPVNGWDQVVVGPSRIFNLRDNYDGTWHFTWTERDGSGTGTMDMPTTNRGVLFPFGDGLVLYTPTQRVQTLSVVDLVHGAVQEPFAVDVSDAHATGDARVEFVDPTTGTGRIQMASPGTDGTVAVATVAALPDRARTSRGVQLEGTTVRATWGGDRPPPPMRTVRATGPRSSRPTPLPQVTRRSTTCTTRPAP